MNLSKSGIIMSFRMVTEDFYEMLVRESGTNAIINFNMDEESAQAVIHAFGTPIITTSADCVGGEIYGNWILQKEGNKKLLDKNHIMVTDGSIAEADQFVERKGKKVAIKTGEKALVGDYFIYGENAGNRYRHNAGDPPKYVFNIPQLNGISALKKAYREAGIPIPTGNSNTVAPATSETSALGTTVIEELENLPN